MRAKIYFSELVSQTHDNTNVTSPNEDKRTGATLAAQWSSLSERTILSKPAAQMYTCLLAEKCLLPPMRRQQQKQIHLRIFRIKPLAFGTHQHFSLASACVLHVKLLLSHPNTKKLLNLLNSPKHSDKLPLCAALNSLKQHRTGAYYTFHTIRFLLYVS